ncbi:MAG: hypothetical protein ACXADW_20715 [Candidatus Hodarchaeales archaeon]|jgi:hypothetical protein
MAYDPNRLLEEIFPICSSNEEGSVTWKAWEEGKSDYKPFSLQLNECSENGNIVKENCPCCRQTLLICQKHGGICISAKCRDDRMKEK